MTTTTRKPPARQPKATVTVVPPEAKRPQDRKPKADAEQTEEQRVVEHAESAVVVREDGLTRITLDGFTIEVPDDAQDDFELLAAIAQLDDAHARGSVSGMLVHFPEVLRRLAGESGWRTVMNGLRGDNERVKVRPAIDYLNAVLHILHIGADEE